MKNKTALIFFLGFLIMQSFQSTSAQNVGIGSESFTPDQSAVLELKSTQQGFLPPRMTTAERDLILQPATGLLIFNTTTNCVEVFIPPIWQSMYCGCTSPNPPTEDTHTPSATEIVWNWNAVIGADGYKYNTINDYSTATDNGTSTTYTQIGLDCETEYTMYVWAYNTCGNSLELTLTENTSDCPFICGTSTVLDIEGNIYNTIQIGNQCWFKENLKTTKYKNDSPISYPGENTTLWQNNTTGAYAWYDNDSATYATLYGALYNWYAVANLSGLCPNGWHIPSNEEWTELADAFGGLTLAGGALKTTGTIENGDGLWYDPNTGATNSSNFSGLPSGRRTSSFCCVGYLNRWWTSSSHNSADGIQRNLEFDGTSFNSDNTSKTIGYSVRCKKD